EHDRGLGTEIGQGILGGHATPRCKTHTHCSLAARPFQVRAMSRLWSVYCSPQHDVARAYRRTLRRLTIAFVALCLVIVILFFTIHTRPVRRYAVNKVMALLAQKHIEFQTDELNYNLLKASLDLKNIRV